MKWLSTAAFLLLFLSACTEKKVEVQKANALFVLEDNSGIDFSNTIKNTTDFNIFSYRNFYNGGGVAIGDINNDGLPDVYLTANMGENKLYLNKGDFKFEDITEKSGARGKRAWSTGVVLVDINNDGFLDIYVCNAGNVSGDDHLNELFMNNGDMTFTEKAKEYGLADNGFTTHAAFFDYDQDGDLDVYILNNSFIPVSSLGYENKREIPEKDWNIDPQYIGGADKLLENQNGVFVDVSKKAGIYGSLIGFGLGVTVGDVNGDFLPDIYVSNDFYERDYLYINQGDGTFKEEGKNWMGHMSMSSMGADMADINNDGKPEIFVTDMLPESDERLKRTSDFQRNDLYQLLVGRDFHHQFMHNSLQLNNGNNTFSEIAFGAGVAATDWSWGALIFDMDNDGYKDIYVSNGIFHDLTDQDFMDFFANEIIRDMTITEIKQDKDKVIDKMPSNPQVNAVFRNNGNLAFSDFSKEWGMDVTSFSNGASYGDLDNDGDLDLIVNNVNAKAFVYKNKTNEILKNNYLKVELKGDSINKRAIGSIVDVFVNKQVIRQELIPSRGFQSSTDYHLVFGLGAHTKIDSVRVVWPNRKATVIPNPQINQSLKVDMLTSKQTELAKSNQVVKTIFKEVPHTMDAHVENNYTDFDYEGLIIQQLSDEGPALAAGDVNGDGLEDIFIGGANGQAGQIYIQAKDGRLSKLPQPAFNEHLLFEDTAATFFDTDGDGDLDLYVGSGGNEAIERKEYRKDRLYFNDGKGKFTYQGSALPESYLNTSVVTAHDFDGDGDIDLFVGTRSVPGIYGINPESFLLENGGNGNFKNVTEAKAFDLMKTGMITDAAWADMTGDGIKDLVVVGDWMAPAVFENSGKRLRLLKSNLDELTGLWNALSVADLDGDGDLDLVLGNKGTNWYLKTSKEKPAKLFVNDFDNNGTIEQIFSKNFNGKDVPLSLRRELAGQIPSLKKEILKFEDYAKKSVQDLFAEKIIENSQIKIAHTFESGIAYNNGDKSFTFKPLPARIQYSCVNSILTTDLNKDGVLDIILAGNNFHHKPQFSRFDASFGDVLLSEGKNGYQWVPNATSGIMVRGQVNDMVWFNAGSGKKYVVMGINNDYPKIYGVNE